MAVRYFTGFCNMNDKDLRANPLHHSCLVIFKAECDEFGDLTTPLQVLNAFGFYSHPVPSKKSLFEDPFTFFTQMKIDIRLRGSFGEWKQERICDLSYGRGLSGRLFAMTENQVNGIVSSIGESITQKEQLLSSMSDLQEQEDYYNQILNNRMAELIEDGVDVHLAREKAKQDMPLREFKFSFDKDSYNCKVAALNMIESQLDQQNAKIMEHLQQLRKHPSVPRLTHDLSPIIIHASTDRWVAHGGASKYPDCSWSDIATSNNSSIYVVDFGGQYVDLDGDVVAVRKLSEHGLQVVDELKSLGRLCELNLADKVYKNCYEQICQFISRFASIKSDNQESFFIERAESCLSGWFTNEEFIAKIEGDVPVNLRARIDQVRHHYNEDDYDDLMLHVC